MALNCSLVLVAIALRSCWSDCRVLLGWRMAIHKPTSPSVGSRDTVKELALPATDDVEDAMRPMWGSIPWRLWVTHYQPVLP